MDEDLLRRTRDVLEGLLHFDDAWIKSGPLGEALLGWKAEAESLLEDLPLVAT